MRGMMRKELISAGLCDGDGDDAVVGIAAAAAVLEAA